MNGTNSDLATSGSEIEMVCDRCSFTFDPDNFPNPEAYLADIKQKYGVKICVWSMSPRGTLSSPRPDPLRSQPLYLADIAHFSGGGEGRLLDQAHRRHSVAVRPSAILLVR